MVDKSELVKFRRQWKAELGGASKEELVDVSPASPRHSGASAQHTPASVKHTSTSPVKQWPPSINLAESVDPDSYFSLEHGDNGPSTSSSKSDNRFKDSALTFDDLNLASLSEKQTPGLIVHNLLNSENRQPDFEEKKKREEFCCSRNKRLKLSWDSNSPRKSKNDDSFVDMFIKDLDEISGIPFFGGELPRDVAFNIFQHLDPLMLCRCAQVSKAWNSIAEDELLWTNICHTLGYEEDTSTIEKSRWKQVVKENVLEEKQLRQNWRMRTGTVESLEYVQGGILYAANSLKYKIAAGYSNGEVRVWDLDTDDCYTLSPSSTALQIDESAEQGTVENKLEHIRVSDGWLAASYSQGNVDIWDTLHKKKQPCQSVVIPRNIQNMECNSDSLVFAAGSLIRQQAVSCSEDSPDPHDYEAGRQVYHICLVPNSPSIIASFYDQVNVLQLGNDKKSTVVHHTAHHEVTCIDCNSLTVAVGLCQDWDSGVVRLYDLTTGKEGVQLKGHAWHINLRDSPSQSLVTGHGPWVKIFDTRLPEAVLTFRGNSHINCVQMDDWKVVFGDDYGKVHVCDQRMAAKLWDQHNRHPVKYLTFMDDYLITANIPKDRDAEVVPFEVTYHSRQRGSLFAYNFSVNQSVLNANLPRNAYSTYEDQEGYSYNIGLAMPYDKL